MITIEQIKAECRKAIELGQSATAGPWVASPFGRVSADCGIILDAVSSASSFAQDDINGNHIAHARKFSPAAAKVVLAEINWLEYQANSYEGWIKIMFLGRLQVICEMWEGQS